MNSEKHLFRADSIDESGVGEDKHHNVAQLTCVGHTEDSEGTLNSQTLQDCARYKDLVI